jgi:hypothetical protein
MLFHEEPIIFTINLEEPAASTNPDEPTAPLSTLKNPPPYHQP